MPLIAEAWEEGERSEQGPGEAPLRSPLKRGWPWKRDGLAASSSRVYGTGPALLAPLGLLAAGD